MGRQSRLHREAVIAGKVPPFRANGVPKKERVLHCGVCGTSVPEHLALRHVLDCWGIEYQKVDEIPRQAPASAIAHYQQKHHIR